MRYALEFTSPWTTFTAGFFACAEECEIHCASHYGAQDIKFKRDIDGLLKATLYAEETVTLILYETDIPHAS